MIMLVMLAIKYFYWQRVETMSYDFSYHSQLSVTVFILLNNTAYFFT